LSSLSLLVIFIIIAVFVIFVVASIIAIVFVLTGDIVFPVFISAAAAITGVVAP
jgi:hypothetical protein